MTTYILLPNNHLVTDTFCQRFVLLFMALVYSKKGGMSKLGVGKIWPMGYIQPSACSHLASELR